MPSSRREPTILVNTACSGLRQASITCRQFIRKDEDSFSLDRADGLDSQELAAGRRQLRLPPTARLDLKKVTFPSTIRARRTCNQRRRSMFRPVWFSVAWI